MKLKLFISHVFKRDLRIRDTNLILKKNRNSAKIKYNYRHFRTPTNAKIHNYRIETDYKIV